MSTLKECHKRKLPKQIPCWSDSLDPNGNLYLGSYFAEKEYKLFRWMVIYDNKGNWQESYFMDVVANQRRGPDRVYEIPSLTYAPPKNLTKSIDKYEVIRVLGANSECEHCQEEKNVVRVTTPNLTMKLCDRCVCECVDAFFLRNSE